MINFYDWICPPYEIKDGSVRFLETLPEEDLSTMMENEGPILSVLNRLGVEFSYTKIIADTNPIYVFQGFLASQDTEKVISSLLNFSREVYEKKFFGRIRVILLSTLLQGIIKEYEDAYSRCMEISYNFELVDTLKYMGLSSKGNMSTKQLTILSKRIASSYAAEGVAFEILDRNGVFLNPVWINTKEPKEMANFTNIYRREKQKVLQVFPDKLTVGIFEKILGESNEI